MNDFSGIAPSHSANPAGRLAAGDAFRES